MVTWLERLAVWALNRRRTRNSAHGDLVLGHAVPPAAGDVLLLPYGRRAQHVVVVGKTGMGKTTFLQHLARQHFHNDSGFIFFDFHGDATEQLISMAIRANQVERIVLLDPTDRARSPAINPLQMNAAARSDSAFARASELASLLKARWRVDTFGARTEELLRNVLYTLSVSGLTLVEAPLLLTNERMRQRLTLRLPSTEIARYWQERYAPLSEAMKSSFREPLLNKITEFITDPACRHFLGQVQGTVDFSVAMETGQFVLVNLAKGRLGFRAHTLANLIFARLQFDVLSRIDLPERNRRLFTVFCDEVQNIAENDLSTLLAEGRKFGVSLVAAHQYWDQLPATMRGALNGAGTHVLFRLSAADAARLGPELSVAGAKRYASELTMLQRGVAIARIGGESPVAVRVPLSSQLSGPLPPQDRDRIAARHSHPRADIEVDIARRHATYELSSSFNPSSNEFPEGQTTWN
jgi:hypothetical protein